MTSLEDADKLYKKANKLCTPSLLHLRLSFDWEQATPMFEKAAAIYKVQHLSYSASSSTIQMLKCQEVVSEPNCHQSFWSHFRSFMLCATRNVQNLGCSVCPDRVRWPCSCLASHAGKAAPHCGVNKASEQANRDLTCAHA